MLKKIASAVLGFGLTVAMAFAAAPASATVSRYAGQVDQDWGGSFYNGIGYDEGGFDSDDSRWTASVVDSADMWVAGIEWDSHSIFVQHYFEGELDATFAGDGQGEYQIDGDATFSNVADIDLAINGDLVITGSFYDAGSNYSGEVEGVYALRITETGGTNASSFTNAQSGAVEHGSLELAVFYPTAGIDLNQDWNESWVEETAYFDAYGDKFVIAGGSWNDYVGDTAWLLYIDDNGDLVTGLGDGGDAGYQYLESDLNNNGTGTQECYGSGYSNGVVYEPDSGQIYWLIDCDGSDAIVALDPWNNGMPNNWYADNGVDPGFVWLNDFSTFEGDSYAWKIGVDSNHDLVLGGSAYSTGWVPYVAKFNNDGDYYMTNSGFDENSYDTFGNSIEISNWNLNDMAIDTSTNDIYFTGSVDTGYEDDFWAMKWGSDLAVDSSWNDGDLDGSSIFGSCSSERANTASVYGSGLYLFGQGGSPVTAPANPWDGPTDATSAKIGLTDWTQTRTTPNAPTWVDSEWAYDYVPGEFYSDDVTASGTGVSYYLRMDLPTGVTLDGTTGEIEGTVDADESGYFSQSICAANAGGKVWAYGDMESPSPYLPNIAATPALDDEAPFLGEELEWTIPVDAFPAGYCWVNDGALPPGLTLDEDTCVVSGTPRIKGDYWFEIGAENSEGSDYREYSGTVDGATESAVEATLTAELGDLVEGSEVDLLGFGLEASSDWYAELRSEPVTIEEGVANEFGWFNITATLPSPIEAGKHTITVYGTDTNGDPMSAVVYITVAEDGTLSYVSTSEEEPAALASTGVETTDINSALLAAAALIAAGVVAIARRRRNV